MVGRNRRFSPDGCRALRALITTCLLLAGAVAACAAPAGMVSMRDCRSPRWFGNGASVVFVSDHYGQTDLFVCDGQGMNVRRLTDDAAEEAAPAWSPDGTRIAFEKVVDGNREICVINVDGTDLRMPAPDPAEDRGPAWAPDGGLIAFWSERGGDVCVWSVRPDGADLRRRIDSRGDDVDPAWSNDGERMCWASTRDEAEGRWRIFTGPTWRLRSADLHGYFPLGSRAPAWSPDDTRIVVVCDGDLQLVGLEDRSVLRLTADPAEDACPAWLPGGDRVGFHSMRGGTAQLYTMATDGTEPERFDAWVPGEPEPVVAAEPVADEDLLLIPRAPGGASSPGPLLVARPQSGQGTQASGGAPRPGETATGALSGPPVDPRARRAIIDLLGMLQEGRQPDATWYMENLDLLIGAATGPPGTMQDVVGMFSGGETGIGDPDATDALAGVIGQMVGGTVGGVNVAALVAEPGVRRGLTSVFGMLGGLFRSVFGSGGERRHEVRARVPYEEQRSRLVPLTLSDIWKTGAAKWGPWVFVSGKNLNTAQMDREANRTVGREARDDWNGRILTIRHGERDLNITFDPNTQVVRVGAGDGEMYLAEGRQVDATAARRRALRLPEAVDNLLDYPPTQRLAPCHVWVGTWRIEVTQYSIVAENFASTSGGTAVLSDNGQLLWRHPDGSGLLWRAEDYPPLG